MIPVVIEPGGMTARFYGGTPEADQILRNTPTLFENGSYHVGCWIDVTKFWKHDIPMEIEGKDRLFEFLSRRQKLVNHKGVRCPTDWLDPEWKLAAYQQEGIARFLRTRRMILADDTGLGKTLTGIGAYMCIRRVMPDARLVVICPSGVREQWALEMDKFVRDDLLTLRDISVVTGNAASRRRALGRPTPVTILHYESLIHDLKQDPGGNVYGHVHTLMSGATMVIFDEASDSPGIRKTTSQVGYRAAAIIEKVPFRLGMTATPLERDVRDIFGMYHAIDPRIFGHEYAFNDTYLDWRRQTIWVRPKQAGREPYKIEQSVPSRSKNLGHLRQRIHHAFLRRTVDEVGHELPKLLPVPVVLDFKTKERKLYMKLEGDAMAAEGQSMFGSEIHKLRLFCCEPSLVKGMPEGLRSPKTEKILKMLEEDFRGKSVLIFSESRPYCELLKKKLGSEAELIIGGVPQARRTQIKNAFNGGSVRIVIGDKAMTRGLNLQELCSVVINADFPPLPSILKQRVGRARRRGSKAKTIRVVTLLVSGTAEEKTSRRILQKAETFDRLFSQNVTSPFEGMTIREMKTALLNSKKGK